MAAGNFIRNHWSWLIWLITTALLATWLGSSLVSQNNRSVFVPGETSVGHHQIEEACETCHTSPLGGSELLQDACEGCHLDELKAVRDSHPRRKFTDPSNADRVAVLDARLCVTCHREHQPEVTLAMGLTVPEDVCFLCHQDIGEERATHEGLAFDTCASSGCHNFHDNTALYENFLVENADQPALADSPHVPALNGLELALAGSPDSGLIAPDAPTQHLSDATLISDWQSSSHALTEVNCSSCHTADSEQWIAKPSLETCEGCHDYQAQGFLAGRHGMRQAVGLSPMTPATARIPMHESAAHLQLDCNSCHGSHRYDLQFAAIEACTNCHNSQHVNAWEDSPHGVLTAEVLDSEAIRAVTCATCHMPRESARINGNTLVRVQHNQNLNLRPSDKMLRSVCMNCHSLEFSLDALADPELVQNNFTGLPDTHIESIDMSVHRRSNAGNRDNTYR